MEYKSSEYYREQRKVLRNQIHAKEATVAPEDKVGRLTIKSLREKLLILTRLQLLSQVGETQLKLNVIHRSKQRLNNSLQLTILDQFLTNNPIHSLWCRELELFRMLKYYQEHIGIVDQFIELGRRP